MDQNDYASGDPWLPCNESVKDIVHQNYSKEPGYQKLKTRIAPNAQSMASPFPRSRKDATPTRRSPSRRGEAPSLRRSRPHPANGARDNRDEPLDCRSASARRARRIAVHIASLFQALNSLRFCEVDAEPCATDLFSNRTVRQCTTNHIVEIAGAPTTLTRNRRGPRSKVSTGASVTQDLVR
jgi:hypothetical protein